jgi:hypothetical protein
MTTYHLARNTEHEAFAVFETEDGLLKRIYPHTTDSANYAEIEALIEVNDSSVVFCDIAVAQALPWAPPEPLTPEQLLEDVRAKRAAEYPPIGDQLDALWKGGEAAAAMLAQVQAVKAKYPKPE